MVRGSARPLDSLTSYELRLTGVNASGVEETGPAVATFATPGVRITSARPRFTAGKVTVTTKLRTSGPGRVDLRATTGPAGTRTWCRTKKRVPSSGIHTIVCNLGSKGRAKLRKAPLRLTLRAALSAGSGQVGTAERRLTIKRRP